MAGRAHRPRYEQVSASRPPGNSWGIINWSANMCGFRLILTPTCCLKCGIFCGISAMGGGGWGLKTPLRIKKYDWISVFPEHCFHRSLYLPRQVMHKVFEFVVPCRPVAVNGTGMGTGNETRSRCLWGRIQYHRPTTTVATSGFVLKPNLVRSSPQRTQDVNSVPEKEKEEGGGKEMEDRRYHLTKWTMRTLMKEIHLSHLRLHLATSRHPIIPASITFTSNTQHSVEVLAAAFLSHPPRLCWMMMRRARLGKDFLIQHVDFAGRPRSACWAISSRSATDDSRQR